MANKSGKPKIAILINSFWNAGAGISGGDQRVMQIFQRIGKDFSLDIYTSKDGFAVIKKEVCEANFIISPENLETGNILFRYRKRANWLIKKLAEKKYDVIYSSSDFFPDVLPAYQYKKKNLKTKWISCIFHIYPNWRQRPGNKIVSIIGSKIQDFSFARINRLADKIINLNYQVQDELTGKYHFDKKKIVVNPCGIDLEYFKNIKVKKTANQCCFIARLVPSKGIFELPEIWSEVVKKVPTAKLKIIGGGSDEIKSKLQASFDILGISKSVEIMGFLENDEAYKILKSSEVFIFPSHEEGFGIAVAEAFASGVPVVAWDLPVYKEVFDHLVETASIGNKKSFAEKISSLLKNRKKLAELASQGENMIRKYSWDEIAKEESKIIGLTTK